MKLLITETYPDGYPKYFIEVADNTPNSITESDFKELQRNHQNYNSYCSNNPTEFPAE